MANGGQRAFDKKGSVMRVYVEIIPEHYVSQASITIKCKESEKNKILVFVTDALNAAEAKQCR